MGNNTLTVDYRKIEDLFSEIEEMKFELEGIVFAAKSMERTLSLASQQVQQMLSDGSGDGSDDELEEEMLLPEQLCQSEAERSVTTGRAENDTLTLIIWWNGRVTGLKDDRLTHHPDT